MITNLVEKKYFCNLEHKNYKIHQIYAHKKLYQFLTFLENYQKSLESIAQSKNYIKEGRGSLFSKANKMKDLGANAKTKIDSFE